MPIVLRSPMILIMPRKKPFGTAADKRNGERQALVIADGMPKVALPEEVTLCELAEDAWGKYWYDPVSAILTVSDHVLVVRWITALDRYFRLVRSADSMPIVTGSQSQQVLNPRYAAAYKALEAAERCERQLGMGPSNRSKLGIELIQAEAEAARRAKHAQQDELAVVERVDPRGE